MGRENLLWIAATDAKEAACHETSLIGRLEAAMRRTQNHWLVTDPSDRFVAAVAGVMTLSTPEEVERLVAEVGVLGGLSRGDLGPMLAADPNEAVGLLQIWWRVTKGSL